MDCYACGQRVSPETLFSDTSTHDEVDSILKTTQHLDDLISSLNVTRSKLLQRLNKLRTSIRVLPPEILSAIFLYTYPPTDFAAFHFIELDENDDAPESHEQLTLGSVSSHWRQVALATPQLWTSAIINIMGINAERKAQLIRLYLTNVGSMTLSLHLTCSYGGGYNTLSDLDPVLNSIQHGASKFKLLSLDHLPKDRFLFPVDRFTRLEDLRLMCTDLRALDPSQPQINFFPCLRRLYVQGTPIHLSSHPPCQNFTILRFVGSTLNTCVRMLLLCPNLVEYSCHDCGTELDTTVNQLSEPMTFHHMKIFYAPCSTTASFASIIRHLNFPVLETLGLELCANTGGLEDLISFISRLPTTWQILEISGNRYSEMTAERIFKGVSPRVQSLHLLGVHVHTLGLVLATLQKFNDNHIPLMEGLRKIHIKASDHPFQLISRSTDLPSSNQQVFLNMVSARKHYLIDGYFLFEVDSDGQMYYCWEYVWEQLKQMDADGFKLNITMAGKTIHPRVG